MAVKKKAKAGAPKWMTTFADLSTLLLTFFILMLSMANIDIVKFREMLGSVQMAFGVQFEEHGNYQATSDVYKQTDEAKTAPEPKKETDQQKDDTGRENSSSQDVAEREHAVSELQNAISQTHMGDMTEISSGSRGIRMRIKGALLFDAGEAELKAQARPLMGTLVQVLNKFDYYILVEGHTDASPIKTPQFPSNWELSGARAAAVLRNLMSTCVGLADSYPLADNDTKEGRGGKPAGRVCSDEKCVLA
jgi:chemotaxis protein MotB